MLKEHFHESHKFSAAGPAHLVLGSAVCSRRKKIGMVQSRQRSTILWYENPLQRLEMLQICVEDDKSLVDALAFDRLDTREHLDRKEIKNIVSLGRPYICP